MTAITQKIQESVGAWFNWRYFLQDNITGSWYLTVWVLLLSIATAVYTFQQLAARPVTTIIVLVLWVVGIGLTLMTGLFKRHTLVGAWLKENLMSSVSNTLLTLILTLVIVSAVSDVWQWAVVNASFDKNLTAPENRNPDGATWGVIIGSWNLLMVGTLEKIYFYRVWMAFGFVAVLGAISFVVNKIGLWKRNDILRNVLTAIWAFSPVVIYIFIAGVSSEGAFIDPLILLQGEVFVLAVYGLLYWQKTVKFSIPSFAVWALVWPILYIAWQAIGKSEAFPLINVATWGGLMLTIVIAVSVILLSFPIGMILALGRRSDIRGIPWWIVWPSAIILTIWAFNTHSRAILGSVRNDTDYVLALWPLLILGTAYLLQKMFKGNMVAAASTAFIEIIRGAPLITLLFMAIIMAPFFLPQGVELENVWAVIIGYALFSSAYMAENIRGGLQALPRGQFEAADALGLNTIQKMRFIILPQALRIVIPAIVGQFIGSFKSSSLVAIVGLFELLGITKVIVANPQWLGLRKELYVFAGIIYFVGSSIMSAYSRRLESKLGVGTR